MPPLFDSDFRCDEEIIAREIEYLKPTPEDFFDVAIDQSGKIVGFPIVRKVPFIRGLFAGAVYTLWVDPKARNAGKAR